MQKKLFDKILSALPFHVYWLDKNNILLGCNEQQAKDVGLSNSNEIIGKTLYDFHAPKYARIYEENNNKVMTLGVPTIMEEEDVNLQGKPVIYLSHKVPIKEKNEVIGIVGISIAITEQRRLEKELAQAKIQAEKILKENRQLIIKLNKEITGEEGYEKAVKMFNAGLIDRFFRKSDDHLFQELINEIANLKMNFFQKISHSTLVTLEKISPKLSFKDSAFIKFFLKIIKQNNIVEYYALD